MATTNTLKKYFKFVQNNRPVYFNFNKQLVIGELAGFAAGVGVAEAMSAATRDEFAISISSGIADYAGSILGFLAIFYRDSKAQYSELARKDRFKRIMKDAFSLWPSVAVADVAYIFARPYVHYILLVSGIEAGIAATIAHFAAFGVFNGVAILSRSIIDYLKSSKQ
ncbi:MAG: hypothetical protein AB1351_01145 [Thermoproteota archaeon]